VCLLVIDVDLTRHRRIIHVRSGLQEFAVMKISYYYYYRKCQILKDIGSVCSAMKVDNTHQHHTSYLRVTILFQEYVS